LFLFNIVKNKGVFGFIIPNTPYFSHTLFTIKPYLNTKKAESFFWDSTF
ncbi:hypothetical protein GW891_00455, partial [bacterium]|nr:hypothetical protein [bacterium]